MSHWFGRPSHRSKSPKQQAVSIDLSRPHVSPLSLSQFHRISPPVLVPWKQIAASISLLRDAWRMRCFGLLPPPAYLLVLLLSSLLDWAMGQGGSRMVSDEARRSDGSGGPGKKLQSTTGENCGDAEECRSIRCVYFLSSCYFPSRAVTVDCRAVPQNMWAMC